jgi:hypothetical protein
MADTLLAASMQLSQDLRKLQVRSAAASIDAHMLLCLFSVLLVPLTLYSHGVLVP